MAEKPINFTGPMVRAILDGRKTQTRRLMNMKDVQFTRDGAWHILRTRKPIGDPPATEFKTNHFPCLYRPLVELAPYQEGDILWVRETWDEVEGLDGTPCVIYRADGERPGPISWRPSTHMSRWASRIELKVLNVRVERAQDITVEDVQEFMDLRDSIYTARGASWSDNPVVVVYDFIVKEQNRER